MKKQSKKKVKKRKLRKKSRKNPLTKLQTKPVYSKYWRYSFIKNNLRVIIYTGTYLDIHEEEIPNMFRFAIDLEDPITGNIKKSYKSSKEILYSSQNITLRAAVVFLKNQIGIDVKEHSLVPDDIYIEEI